jgi:hypothetical protein
MESTYNTQYSISLRYISVLSRVPRTAFPPPRSSHDEPRCLPKRQKKSRLNSGTLSFPSTRNGRALCRLMYKLANGPRRRSGARPRNRNVGDSAKRHANPDGWNRPSGSAGRKLHQFLKLLVSRQSTQSRLGLHLQRGNRVVT